MTIIAVVLFGILVAGCKDVGKTDVTHDPSYGDFSRLVGIWKTRVPSKLSEEQGELYLTVEPDHYMGRKLLLSLPPGTEVRVERLIHEKVFGGSPNHVMGSLTSGSYAGQSVHLDDDFFCPNPYNRLDSADRTPKNFKFNWTVAPDKLQK
jgi:hypothetical protein